jgi:uncharacterized metal-binding protein
MFLQYHQDKNHICMLGCNLDCGKLTMEKNGVSGFYHIRLTDWGSVKGQTPPSAEIQEEISLHAM